MYIDEIYFCVVKMEELFAIAAGFRFFVRNRGFSPTNMHARKYENYQINLKRKRMEF
jgi:hypothetical protein